jgi:hypothetical protein
MAAVATRAVGCAVRGRRKRVCLPREFARGREPALEFARRRRRRQPQRYVLGPRTAPLRRINNRACDKSYHQELSAYVVNADKSRWTISGFDGREADALRALRAAVRLRQTTAFHGDRLCAAAWRVAAPVEEAARRPVRRRHPPICDAE